MFTDFFLTESIWLKSIICLISSYSLGFIGIKAFLKQINTKQILRQPIREDGPQTHVAEKKNTPTMGGIFIVTSTLITSLLFMDLGNPYLLATLFVFTLFGAIGLIDDLEKVLRNNTKGLSGSAKLIIQFTIISATLLWLGHHNNSYFNGEILIPLTDNSLFIGLTLYALFASIVIVGSSNAVNLTDGLDGLVSVPVIVNLICLFTMVFVISNPSLAEKFTSPHIANTQELLFFCSSLIGSVLAFLSFNLKPAKIFMGDVGSLPLGSVLGLIAIIVKQELVFFILSILFVCEAVSVILQVGSYKLRKKRIFLMAPLHHHFEQLGWGERKVVKSFWAASLFFALLGMSLFFL